MMRDVRYNRKIMYGFNVETTNILSEKLWVDSFNMLARLDRTPFSPFLPSMLIMLIVLIRLDKIDYVKSIQRGSTRTDV